MNNKPNNNEDNMAIGMALGLCIGAAIGSITKNIGLWISVGLCLGVAFGSAFSNSDNNEALDNIIIKFNREAVCMGDDIYNDIYKIEMPANAALGDLMNVVRYGGSGNDWHITSGYKWDIYTNIGKIATINPQIEKVIYYEKKKDTLLSDLDIKWIYAAREIDEIDINRLEDIFRD